MHLLKELQHQVRVPSALTFAKIFEFDFCLADSAEMQCGIYISSYTIAKVLFPGRKGSTGSGKWRTYDSDNEKTRPTAWPYECIQY